MRSYICGDGRQVEEVGREVSKVVVVVVVIKVKMAGNMGFTALIRKLRCGAGSG